MNNKVSVIIPTYKRSEFLLRAIDSVLNQNYSNIEVIVVDDNDTNSTFRQETEKKMEKYRKNEKIVYVKNKKNLGGALARNQGIYIASGDFITFLDDDDIYLPDKVGIQLQYMIKNNIDMSFTDVRIHDINDKLIDYREHPYIKDLSNNELLKQHILHHLTPTATYMFKKETITNIGCFDDVEMGQEFMLMLKAIESDVSIGYIPKAGVIQYLHPGERISVGQNKIKKEVEMYNFKKRYFKYLTFRQKQYVKFRHHAVMLVVGMRSKKPLVLLEHLLKGIFTSPLDCLKELIYYVKKIKKYQLSK